MESRLEVLDAFVDGERVDASAVKAALADPAGRDYFVDLWLLREAVHPEPAADAVAPVTPAAARPARSGPRPWVLAAAFAGAVIGGYAIGFGTSGRVPTPAASPAPTSVTRTPPASAFPAPAPTRTIQLEFHGSQTSNGGN